MCQVLKLKLSLSTGHVHAVVSATVRLVGKKPVSCKIDVGDVAGHFGAVGHRIAPATSDQRILSQNREFSSNLED